jgi:23S rRNA A2030 N6-methylase RlmJ
LGAGPLTANGMVVINPPYVLYDELAMIMPELVASLARGTGAHHQLIWLAQS